MDRIAAFLGPRRLTRAVAAALDTLGVAAIPLGRLTEQIVRLRHRRRLRRTQHLAPGRPLTALGAQQTYTVRPGNAIDVLIDGDDAFAAMLAAIRSARHSIWITGWHASPDFALDRGPDATSLGRALREASDRGVQTRVLLWAGAPVPAIHPTRKDAEASAAAFNALPGVRCLLDKREYLLDCHHEKLLVVDGAVGFAGGLDFTAYGSDRWDTSTHDPRPSDGWHDAAIEVRGPAVADLEHHIRQRWTAISGETVPAAPVPAPAGTVGVRVVRTVPEKVYDFCPDGDFGILAAYLDALAAAQRLIYLENQFLWAVEVVDLLVDKLRHPPTPGFRLVLVLPDKAHTGQDATLGQLSRLVDADAGAGRLVALTPQSDTAAHHVYVHAKVALIDDHWVTVGSANLNSHSLFNDTEVNVVIDDAGLARATREQLWREHTGVAVTGDPTDFIDNVLRPLATEQSRRRAAGLEPTARVRLLDHVSRRGDLVLGPLSALVVDG